MIFVILITFVTRYDFPLLQTHKDKDCKDVRKSEVQKQGAGNKKIPIKVGGGTEVGDVRGRQTGMVLSETD